MGSRMKTCGENDCERPLLAKGLCRKHYMQKWNGTKRPGSRDKGTLEERYWRKVVKGPDCWAWDGAKTSFGYGKLGIGAAGAGTVDAHRLSWQIHNGPIPGGMCVMHKCDNPECSNPDHLMLGTHADNAWDKVAKGRWRGGDLRGSQIAIAKLTESQVREIKADTRTLAQVAADYGVSQGTIWNIRKRRTWLHVS